MITIEQAIPGTRVWFVEDRDVYSETGRILTDSYAYLGAKRLHQAFVYIYSAPREYRGRMIVNVGAAPPDLSLPASKRGAESGFDLNDLVLISEPPTEQEQQELVNVLTRIQCL